MLLNGEERVSNTPNQPGAAGIDVQARAEWIVGVGASGSAGLQDLRALLAAWPVQCPAGVMVVLHRPADRPSLLAQVLQSSSSIPVVVAEQGAVVQPGVCYVGEPSAHLTLDRWGRIDLAADALYRNRTIDLLFNSLAAHAAPGVLGVVLSGSLDDGSRGLAAIAAAGGKTLVIAPDGAHGGQMPDNAVLRCGHVDFRGRPFEIAGQISRMTSAAAPAASAATASREGT